MKKIIGYAALACLIVCLGCHTHQKKSDPVCRKVVASTTSVTPTNVTPSVIAQQIIGKLRGSIPNVEEMKANTIPSDNQNETVYVPPPTGMSDGFSYIITIDHKTKKYWLTKMGGVAGSIEKYGPIDFGK